MSTTLATITCRYFMQARRLLAILLVGGGGLHGAVARATVFAAMAAWNVAIAVRARSISTALAMLTVGLAVVQVRVTLRAASTIDDLVARRGST